MTNNSFDNEYNNLVKLVLQNGNYKSDRTNVGTLSYFGHQMRFDISRYFPLLTTKKVYMRGVVEELLWMLKGETNSNILSKKGVKIWDANGSKEFLEKNNLPYEEGELGPVYGHQWRHYNAVYEGSDSNYSGKGIDQITILIDNIKKNPDSRRHILNAWNPCQIDEMALPPCHILCQFYCNIAEKSISCQMYQRSGDIGLGVPFNIASYSLLTYIIGHYTGFKPKAFIHTLGDAHIYSNHVDILEEQIKPPSYKPPVLKLVDMPENFQDLTIDNIVVNDYEYHKTLKMSMAV